MAREDVRFTRRDVREAFAWSDTQLKVHLARLADLEYLAVHPLPGRGGRYGYELVYRGEGEGGERFLLGLLDVERLRASGYDPNRSGSPAKRSGSDSNRSGSKPNRSGSGRPPVGERSGGGPGRKSSTKPSKQGASTSRTEEAPETTSRRKTSGARSYPEAQAARGAP